MPDVGPTGFTFNQFLVRDDEPFLFHTGMRQLFPAVREAVARVLPVDSIRWISFGHVEADECGAMNDFLAAAPDAQVVHGELACMVSLNDLADRPPRAVADGEVLGPVGTACGSSPRRTCRTTGRAGCGSTRRRRRCSPATCSPRSATGPAIVTDGIVDAAMTGEEVFHATSIGAATVPTLRRLADLGPTTLATMHGSSYSGDGAGQLLELADAYTALVAAGV